MSFPFGPDVRALRQRILFAIGGSGLLGLTLAGCDSLDESSKDGGASDQPAGAGSSSAGMTSSTGGRGGSTGTAGKPPVVVDAGKPVSCDPGFMPTEQCFTRMEMESKARFGCGQVQITPMPTDEQVMAAFMANGCLPMDKACDGCCNPPTGEGEPMGDGSCCYVFCPGACCGRPFAIGGELRVAGVRERGDWLAFAGAALADAVQLPVPAALARRIAQEWLDDARMEHASIASFARFTLDLLAAGAPAELLALAQQAALDEVAHAQACFALASRHAGTAFGPDALATADCKPAASLADAVVSAFREGCIGETLAAAQARAALAVAGDHDVRAALTRIAEDEARHAELAWRFVAWGAERCDERVRAQLREALAQAVEAQPAPGAEHESAEARTALHAAGRLTAAERADLGRRALREVVVPCADALLAQDTESKRSRAGATDTSRTGHSISS